MRSLLLTAVLAGLVVALGTDGLAAEAVAQTSPAEQEEAPEVKQSPMARYCRARTRDFLDIFNLKLALSDGASMLMHVRATRFAQIGAGRFAGTKVGFQGASAGIYGEGRLEVGVSVFYWAWIGRKTTKKGITEDALKTNCFFGNVEDIKAEETYKEYYDANRPWHTLGFAFALPFLPGIEAEFNAAEGVDFFLSLFNLRGVRIPPPFYKVEVHGEKIPARGCIRWHGQEEFEQYD